MRNGYINTVQTFNKALLGRSQNKSMHRTNQPLSLTSTMHRLMARAPMLRVVLPFALGIACADILPPLEATLLLVFITVAVMLIALTAFTRVRWSRLPFLAALWAFFMVFGILLATLHRTTPADGLPSEGWGTQGGSPAILQVRLDDSPHQSRRSYKVAARVEGIWHNDEWVPASCPILLFFHKDSMAAALHYADRLIVRARPQLPDSCIQPHQFDYRRYLLRKGIAWQSYVPADGWQHLPDSPARHGGLKAWSKQVQQALLARLQATSLSPRHKGIAAALLLGWRDDLDDLVLLHFRQAGIAHLLCVSGLHVGIVAWMAGLLFFFMGKLRWQRVLKGSVSLVAVWAFAFVTGLAPSTLRAAVMFSLLIVGGMLQERSLPLNDLCTSALLLLIINPNLLFDVGFQLSYTAVAGILLWREPLSLAGLIDTDRWWNRSAYHLWKLIRLTISAQIFTLPDFLFPSGLHLVYHRQPACGALCGVDSYHCGGGAAAGSRPSSGRGSGVAPADGTGFCRKPHSLGGHSSLRGVGQPLLQPHHAAVALYGVGSLHPLSAQPSAVGAPRGVRGFAGSRGAPNPRQPACCATGTYCHAHRGRVDIHGASG